MAPHRGVLILVLGILSLVGCGVFTAIPAVIMGGGDLKKMDAGQMDPDGRQLTNVGRILGFIGLVFFAIGLVIFVLAVAGGLGTAAMEAGSMQQAQ